MKGFAEAINIFAGKLYGTGYAGHKITPAGFMAMLLNNKAKLESVDLSGDKNNGHCVPVKVRYQKRITPSFVSTNDDCNIEHIPTWETDDALVTKIAKLGIFIPFEKIRKYYDAASKPVQVGSPSTKIMMELWDTIVHASNAIIGNMNNTLLAEQAINFGVNIISANNAATVVNFPKDGTINDYDTGLTKILSDAMENEFMGNVDIVGAGHINSHQIQKGNNVKGLNSGGLNDSNFNNYRFYYDPYTRTTWGANHVGVFEKGSVQLLDINEHKGFSAGEHGAVSLFTIPIPVMSLNSVGEYPFIEMDAMLMFNECPKDIPVLDVATQTYVNQTQKMGYYLILKKKYDSYYPPADIYRADDRLYQVNGTMRFEATHV